MDVDGVIDPYEGDGPAELSTFFAVVTVLCGLWVWVRWRAGDGLGQLMAQLENAIQLQTALFAWISWGTLADQLRRFGGCDPLEDESGAEFGGQPTQSTMFFYMAALFLYDLVFINLIVVVYDLIVRSDEAYSDDASNDADGPCFLCKALCSPGETSCCLRWLLVINMGLIKVFFLSISTVLAVLYPLPCSPGSPVAMCRAPHDNPNCVQGVYQAATSDASSYLTAAISLLLFIPCCGPVAVAMSFVLTIVAGIVSLEARIELEWASLADFELTFSGATVQLWEEPLNLRAVFAVRFVLSVVRLSILAAWKIREKWQDRRARRVSASESRPRVLFARATPPEDLVVESQPV